MEAHYENTPVQYTTISLSCKEMKISLENFDTFYILAQNIDCENTLTASARQF